MRTSVLIVALCCLSAGCAGTRVVRSSGEGRWSVGSDMGGPLVLEGGGDATPFLWPAALGSLYGRYGLQDGVDLFGGVSVAPLGLGTLWVDLGGAFTLWEQDGWKPYLLGSLAANVATNFSESMFLPQATLTASWRSGRWLPYLGWDSILEVWPGVKYGGIPFVGLRCAVGRTTLWAETRYFVPWADSSGTKFNYLSIADRGALGLGFGLEVAFGQSAHQ